MVSEDVLRRGKARLRKNFTQVWNVFVGEVDKAAQNFADSTFEYDLDLDEEVIEVATQEGKAIQFEQVPHRVGDKSTVVDVCVQFKQRVAPINEEHDNLEIQESKVNLTYLDTTEAKTGDGVKLLRGLRFEFDQQPQEHHPVFHVHYDRRCIDSQVLIDEYEIDPSDDQLSNPDYPRVPSAPMDLFSVIQLVLQDHAPDEINDDGWPSGIGNQFDGFPRFPSSLFSLSPQGGSPMVSDWWYLHQSVDDDGNHRRSIPLSRIPRGPSDQ